MEDFARESHRQQLAKAHEQAKLAPQPLPEVVSWREFCASVIQRPKPIILSLFDQGSSMVIGGGSKTFKSWALSDLAVSIASGVPWWGFDTTKGAVIYCNFELKPYYCRERFLAISKAKTLEIAQNLYIWNLRGQKLRILDFRDRLLEEIERYGILCVMIDPFYKLLGDKDERISSELMPILEIFEQINAQSGASTICAAHFTKGNQAAKDPMDRISGGAALNRHPDALIVLTRHETESGFTIDIIARDYPPIEPFVIKWEYPLFKAEPELDPAKLKEPKKGGRPVSYQLQDLIELLREIDQEGCASAQALGQLAKKQIGMSERTFFALWKELRAKGMVYQSKIDGNWHIQANCL